MTEIQDRKKGGPILYDFDFRYIPGTTERQFTNEHITDIVELLCIHLNNLCETSKLESFPIFIFKRDNVNDVGSCVKDGIQIIIGVKMKHGAQMVLRDMMLKDIGYSGKETEKLIMKVMVKIKLSSNYWDIAYNYVLQHQKKIKK